MSILTWSSDLESPRLSDEHVQHSSALRNLSTFHAHAASALLSAHHTRIQSGPLLDIKLSNSASSHLSTHSHPLQPPPIYPLHLHPTFSTPHFILYPSFSSTTSTTYSAASHLFLFRCFKPPKKSPRVCSLHDTRMINLKTNWVVLSASVLTAEVGMWMGGNDWLWKSIGAWVRYTACAYCILHVHVRGCLFVEGWMC
jgi:hypothetical protein